MAVAAGCVVAGGRLLCCTVFLQLLLCETTGSCLLQPCKGPLQARQVSWWDLTQHLIQDLMQPNFLDMLYLEGSHDFFLILALMGAESAVLNIMQS